MLLGPSKSIWGFDPRSIPGFTLWLDGADNDTMNSTSAVTVWNDKSGQSNNMTGSGTWSGGTMLFNGTTNAFSNTAYVFPFGAYSMFAVYSNTTPPASTAYMNVVYGSNGFPMLGVYDVNDYISARSVVANTGALVGAVPTGWAARITNSTSSDIGRGIAIDTSGNVLVIGQYGAEVTFVNPGGEISDYLVHSGGGQDCFVAKYSPAGVVLWATRIASTGNEQGNAVATDTAGNVFVTGSYGSALTVYNTGGGIGATLAHAGGGDCFVVKYSTVGVVLWATRISGSGFPEIGNGIATDTSGNVVVVGQYGSNTTTLYNANGTSGQTLPGGTGTSDCFVAKYSSAGAVLWGAQIGSAGVDIGRAIDTDTSDNVFVTGQYAGVLTLYNTGGGIGATLGHAGSNDCFIAKYSPVGVVLWAAQIASTSATSSDIGNGIATDASGNVFVIGQYSATVITLYNTGGGIGATLGYRTNTDCFIAKYSPVGVVLWAAQIAGGGTDIGNGIAIDPSGNALVTGRYSSTLTLYNTGGGISTTLPPTGGSECFVAKYSSAGTVLWATRIAGTGTDIGYGIATDTAGNVVVTGSYDSAAVTIYNTNGGIGATLPHAGGATEDCFVVKYNPNGFITTALTSASSNVLVSATYTPSTFSPFVNGFAQTTLAGTTLATTGIFVGGPSNYFSGSISEVLVFGTTLTTVQRQSVEGYLSRKWGIGVGLLSTHPFSAIPPFNRYFNPTDIPGCTLWLDGIDNSTMNSTTTVTSWSDKSGLNNTMTGTATWSGRSMAFNGSTQAFSNLSYVFPTSAYSMFGVYSNTTPPAATAYMNAVYGSNGFPMLGVYDRTAIGTWTPQTPPGSGNWQATAIGSTGSNIVACINNGYIWTGSYNGSAWVWTQQTALGTKAWVSCASDSNGSNICAGTRFAGFWTGKFNGSTWVWTEQTGIGTLGTSQWSSTASDLTGSNICTAERPGYIWTGRFNGTTWAWTQQTATPSNGWLSIASDSTGSNICAGMASGFIWTGSYNGSTWAWTQQTAYGPINWFGLASDSTGSNIFAVVNNTSVYTGKYNGSIWTWAIVTSTQPYGLTRIASDSTGSNVVVCSSSAYIYTGKYDGTTWTWAQQTGAGSNTWSGIASDSSGSNLVAGYNGFFLTGTISLAGLCAARSVVANTGALGVGWAARIASTTTGTDRGNAIATDPSGNVYVAGQYTLSPLTIYNQGPTGTAGTTLSNAGNTECFVAKYSPAGTVLWAARISTVGNDQGNAIATDASGNVFVTGEYGGALTVYNQGPSGTAGTTLPFTGGVDCFVAKYSTDGAVLWAARIGGTGNDYGLGIATDTTGDVFVTGRYGNALTLYNQGPSGTAGLALPFTALDDVFVAKYSSNGGVLWAAQIAGTGIDIGRGIATDTTGGVFVTGRYGAALTVYNYGGTVGTTLPFAGINDCFVAKYAAFNGAVLWAAQIAGTGDDQGYAIDTDTSGNVLVIGQYGDALTVYNQGGTVGTTLPFTGGTDCFVAKYSSAGAVLWAARITGANTDIGNGIATDPSDNVFVTGQFNSALTFYNQGPSGTAGATLSNVGGNDCFVAKYSSAGTVLWAAQIAASSTDIGYGIATDTAGNVVVTGYYSTGLTVYNQGPSRIAATTLPFTGGNDCFVVKYSPDGYVTTFPASSNVLVSVTYTPSTLSPFVNGTTASTLLGTTLATTGIFVGGPSNYFNGSISELLVYASTLSAAQRQQVEGYLIQKWGLSAQTVAGHQYKLISPASVVPFQPANISTPLLWFDAADTSTISFSTGSVISRWLNKGSSGANAKTRTGSLTSGVTTLNGLNLVNCPASANLGFTVGIPNQPRAWFVVFMLTSQLTTTGTTQYFALINQTTGSGQDGISGPMSPTNIATDTYSIGESASGIATNINTVTAPNGFNVMKQYGFINSAASTSSNFITVNGTPMTLNVSLVASGYQTASVLYTLGDTYGGSGADIAEIILFNTELTTPQRQQIEGYLGWKWGIRNTLPATHPYSKFPPAVP